MVEGTGEGAAPGRRLCGALSEAVVGCAIAAGGGAGFAVTVPLAAPPEARLPAGADATPPAPYTP